MKTALITIGSTREYIDPGRYIANESSGQQGMGLIKSLLKKNYCIVCLHGYLQTKLITPPKINDGGETIICDGSKLWEKLSPSCKNFFKKEPVEYDVKINLDNKNQGIKKKWFLNYPGIYNEFLDLNKNIMTFKYKTFAVEKNYFNSKLFFCNHLLSVKDKDESQIKKVSYKSKPIPKKYFEEIKNTSEKITYSHIWKRNQIFMIDNHRFMHGRNKIFKKSKRDIINSQTLVANLL